MDTILAKTRLGSINIETTGIQAFHLPAIVPTTAKEVLLFVDVLVGQTSPTKHSHVKIYTVHEGIHYAKYVSAHMYYQPALYVNSDNIWFPLCKQDSLCASTKQAQSTKYASLASTSLAIDLNQYKQLTDSAQHQVSRTETHRTFIHSVLHQY